MKRAVILAVMFACLHVTVYAADEAVVAKIGEKKVTLEDFNRWLSYGPGPSPQDSVSENKVKASMLHQIVTGMVISDIARRDGFDERPDMQEKITLVVNNLLTLEYLDKVVAVQVTASDEDIQSYYEENREKYRSREVVRARHILVKAEKTASDEEKQKARKKAEEILDKVNDGGDFSALALEYSDDQTSKERGGNLGWFSRGQMTPEFESAAFSMAPGTVSGIIGTRYGYHIIRVDERRDAEYQPLDEVRKSIEDRLTRDKRRKVIDDFVQKAMKDADVIVDVKPLIGSDPHFAE